MILIIGLHSIIAYHMTADYHHFNDPFIFHLPKIAQPNFEEDSGIVDIFRPVMKSRKYNMLKMKELRGHIDKDRRMGRTQSRDSQKAKEEEALHANHASSYLTSRNERNKRVFNGSFVNMTEKLKLSTRYYWSVSK